MRGVRGASHRPRLPLAFENAPLPLNWVLRIIFIRKLKEKTKKGLEIQSRTADSLRHASGVIFNSP